MAMTQTSSCPSTTDFSHSGRQSLPPIHETLMPLRQTRPLPSLRDALSSGSAGQQPALMCGVASNLSPLVSSCSSSPIAATSTIHDSRTVSPRFMPLTTTSSLNGARLNAAASPTPQQPQHELGACSSDAASKSCTSSQSFSSAFVEDGTQQFYAVHAQQSAHNDYPSANQCQSQHQQQQCQQEQQRVQPSTQSASTLALVQEQRVPQQQQPTYRYITLKTDSVTRATYVPASARSPFTSEHYQPRVDPSSESITLAHPSSQRVTYLVSGANTTTSVPTSTSSAHLQRLYAPTGSNALQGSQIAGGTSSASSPHSCLLSNARQTSSSTAVGGHQFRCSTNYVPLRTFYRSTSINERKASSRSSTKKEPMDAKNVEEEVARNVSQILSASLNQKATASNSPSGLASGSSQSSSAKSSNLSNSSSSAASASLSGLAATSGCGALNTLSTTRKYVCVDCQKSVSCARNLQRHRMSCKSALASSANSSSESQPNLASVPFISARQLGDGNCAEAMERRASHYSADYSGSAHSAAASSSLTTTSVVSYSTTDCMPQTNGSVSSLSTVSNRSAILPDADDRLGPECEDSFLESAVAELAQNDDLSMITPGSLASGLLDDERSLPPLAFNEDGLDVCPLPASEQTSFSNSATSNPSGTMAGQIRAASSVDVAALYQCESCNKRVSSSRSLKRHRSTCKLYQLDFGHLLNVQQHTQPRTNVANSACESSPAALGAAVLRSPVSSGGSSTLNVCEHCNRSLCSASNLKRHRATCKAANARNENGSSMAQVSVSSASLPANAQNYENIEVDERERSILDRSYAAAVAASRQSLVMNSSWTSTTRRRTASGGATCASLGSIPQQHTLVTTAADASSNTTLKLGMIANKPWITVGEHLRAQHNQRVIQQRQQQQLLEQQQRSAMQQNACATQSANAALLAGGSMVQQASSGAATAAERSTLSIGSVEQDALMHQQQKCTNFSTMAQFDVASATRSTTHEPNTSNVEVATPSSLIKPTSLNTTLPLTDSRQQPPHDAQNKQIGGVDGAPYRCDRGSATVALAEGRADGGEVSGRLLNIPVCDQDQKSAQKETEKSGYSSSKTTSAACFSITSTVSPPLPQCAKNETRPLVSIITTTPLTGRRASDAAPQQTSSAAVFATPVACGGPPTSSYLDPLDYRYECPECQKTYSCRKNVKRHRMAVHKMSPEDVAKAEPVRVLLSSEDPQKRQMALAKAEEKDAQSSTSSGSQMQCMSSRVESSVENSVSLSMASSTQQAAPSLMRASNTAVTSSAPITPSESWSQPVVAYQFTEDDGAQLAKIEEDLRRSAEFKFANFTEPDSESEAKKPVAELAEADTTFNEEYDDPNCRLSSSHRPSITPTAGMVSPSSGPSSNSSTCSSYPITSSNTFMHMSMALPPTATASGFAAQLPPIKSSLTATAPLAVSTQPQQQASLLHIAGTTVMSDGVVLAPTQNVQQQQTRPQAPAGSYMQSHVVIKQKQPHICVDCNRTLSSDYSLKRHRSTCVEVKAAAAAAAKAATEAAKHAPQFFQEASSTGQTTYLISSDPMMDQQLQPKSISYATAETNARMTRQLAPLNSKTSEMIMTQTFSAFDDDADNGVLCRVCDCWLPGQREFERHCDELHPVAADPDSTTVANSHDSSVTPPSAFLLSSPNSDIGSHSSAPYSPAGTRKRTLAYDTNDDLGSQCAKSGKHLCQACGKFYSSEWNLERHKRESCPLRAKRSKIGDDKGSSRLTRLDSLDLTPLQPVDPKWVDDCALVVGDSRIGVSRSVLSRSSAYFASLFQYYDSHSDVPLPVPVDPVVFQQAVEVFKGTLPLDDKNIDCVIYMADKFKLKPLYEKCEGFIAEKLPSSSVMHAIRLAEQYRMSEIKQALFDSISIDVFRSLAADEDYRQMGAELKAELLEKWGTFL